MKPINPSILRNDPLLHWVWEQLGQPPDCRVVGGYLRDRILGRASNDLDLTVDGDADGALGLVRRLGRALGVRPHLLGTAPYRIWRIETPDFKIELWPLGELTLEEDILRRDFTCNALSWKCPNGPLVDLVGGLDDIEHHRMRAISRSNLEDDPVRLLRGPRFLAQLTDFELDGETLHWTRELAPLLREAPRERLGAELLSLLRAPSASRGLRTCLDLGLLEPAAPETCTVDAPWLYAHLGAMDCLNADLNAGRTPARGRFGEASDAARLALLFRTWGIPRTSALSSYGWPKSDRENALKAARLLDDALATVEASPEDRREFAWKAGRAFPALMALTSTIEPYNPGWTRWSRQWLRDPEAFIDPRPLLSGMEIAEVAGIEPGPQLGTVAEALLRAQVRGEVRSRSGAVRWLVRRVARRVAGRPHGHNVEPGTPR